MRIELFINLKYENFKANEIATVNGPLNIAFHQFELTIDV